MNDHSQEIFPPDKYQYYQKSLDPQLPAFNFAINSPFNIRVLPDIDPKHTNAILLLIKDKTKPEDVYKTFGAIIHNQNGRFEISPHSINPKPELESTSTDSINTTLNDHYDTETFDPTHQGLFIDVITYPNDPTYHIEIKTAPISEFAPSAVAA